MEHRGSTREPSGPKERTRRLLREAVRELLRTGGPLTVPAAAERAGVSRATAYRYFPHSARAAEVVRARGAWAFDHETELRTFLRLSLESARERDKPRRGLTSRDLWIADLLESLPPEVPPAARDRLAKALVPLFGADASVWTTDITELSREEATELLAWMAQDLVKATLAGW